MQRMIARRALFALVSGLLLADAPLRPILLPAEGGAPVLLLPKGGRIACPPMRARVVGELPFRAGPVVALRFGWDAGPATQDLLALIAEDGTLLALERLAWQRGGANFITRFAMLPDREHLALERAASLPGSPPRHESWTDYLRRDSAGLHDAPARPVLAGTLQAALSAERTLLAYWAGGQVAAMPPPMLTALSASPFGEGAAGHGGQIG